MDETKISSATNDRIAVIKPDPRWSFESRNAFIDKNPSRRTLCGLDAIDPLPGTLSLTPRRHRLQFPGAFDKRVDQHLFGVPPLACSVFKKGQPIRFEYEIAHDRSFKPAIEDLVPDLG